jgi:GC-rich sequence DNA-binding factor
MISQRRRADDEDDLSFFFGDLATASQPDTELDELGRTVPRANPIAARNDRVTARALRRSRRHATSTQTQTEDGYSTDSSLPPPDHADMNTALNELSISARAILSDVRAEEFKNPSLGLGKWFGEWRERYGDIYTGAWGGLGLVGAWEFWVRLEIVGWNPIEDSRSSLDDFAWYGALYEYSRPPVEDAEPELGPDGDLVSAMISTAIVPRLCAIVEGGAFDPYSVKSLRRMLDIAEQVEASVGKDNLKFQVIVLLYPSALHAYNLSQMLLKSVFTVFANEASSAESILAPYLSLNRPPFNPESILARQRFLARLTKLVQNIIQWRKYAGERYGIGELATRLVNKCIAPVAESGWDVGGMESVRKVSETHGNTAGFTGDEEHKNMQVMTILPPELVPLSLKTRLQ